MRTIFTFGSTRRCWNPSSSRMRFTSGCSLRIRAMPSARFSHTATTVEGWLRFISLGSSPTSRNEAFVPTSRYPFVRPVTLYDTRIIEQVPYPQCECVQSGRYGAEKPHLMSYGFKRQSMRIFKVRPKARKNKVFHPYSEKIGRPPSGALDRGHGAQHRSRHFPSEKRAARSKTLPTPNIRRPRPMNERFKTTRPLSGI